jgi:hypothetical protein
MGESNGYLVGMKKRRKDVPKLEVEEKEKLITQKSKRTKKKLSFFMRLREPQNSAIGIQGQTVQIPAHASQ